MILRSPTREDIPAMAKLWASCFSDPEKEVEGFLSQVLRPEFGLVAQHPQGGLAAMLTMLPVMMHTNTNIYKGSYLYGVCTHPDFRGQGWFHKLMDRAVEEAKAQKRQFLCLVPEGETLFSLYSSLGFETLFYRAKRELNPAAFQQQQVLCTMEEIGGGYYIKLRQLYLSSLPLSVQFDGTLQDYLYQDLKAAGCRMVSVQCRYGHGCVVFTQEKDTITIWEAAMDPICFYSTISTLAQRFEAKRVLLTAHPVYANSERELTPYGMYLPLEEKLSLSLEKHPHPYMNLMLDL